MTIPAGHFDDLYAASADPYGFGDRWYERRKRALTLAALPRPRFARAIEPGCSIGYLSIELAKRCDELVASDLSEVAVGIAAQRLADVPGAQVRQRALPADWPEGDADLVVLSELLYYFDDADLDMIIDRAVGSLVPGGILLACHWRRPAPHPQTANEVHDRLAARHELERLSRYADEDLLLDTFARVPPAASSVAEAEGIV